MLLQGQDSFQNSVEEKYDSLLMTSAKGAVLTVNINLNF
jgi:hypothetical protein